MTEFRVKHQRVIIGVCFHVYREKKFGRRGYVLGGVIICMRVWRMCGGRDAMVVSSIRNSIDSIRESSGALRSEAVDRQWRVSSSDRPRHQSSLNSHKYVDSPASRPIVSRGEWRDAWIISAKFLRSTDENGGRGSGGGRRREDGDCEITAFMKKKKKARTQARKEEENKSGNTQASLREDSRLEDI